MVGRTDSPAACAVIRIACFQEVVVWQNLAALDNNVLGLSNIRFRVAAGAP